MPPATPLASVVDMKGNPVPERPRRYYQFRTPPRWHHYARCFLEAPRAVKQFIAANPEFNKSDWEFMFRCTIHEGEWLVYIDSLAPWHWERCECAKCQRDRREEFRPRAQRARVG